MATAFPPPTRHRCLRRLSGRVTGGWGPRPPTSCARPWGGWAGAPGWTPCAWIFQWQFGDTTRDSSWRDFEVAFRWENEVHLVLIVARRGAPIFRSKGGHFSLQICGCRTSCSGSQTNPPCCTFFPKLLPQLPSLRAMLLAPNSISCRRPVTRAWSERRANMNLLWSDRGATVERPWSTCQLSCARRARGRWALTREACQAVPNPRFCHLLLVPELSDWAEPAEPTCTERWALRESAAWERGALSAGARSRCDVLLLSGAAVDTRDSHRVKEADEYTSVARRSAGTRRTDDLLIPRTAISKSHAPAPIRNSEAKRPRAGLVDGGRRGHGCVGGRGGGGAAAATLRRWATGTGPPAGGAGSYRHPCSPKRSPWRFGCSGGLGGRTACCHSR